METVTIQSRMVHFEERSITVEIQMLNQAKTQLKSLMWCHFVHFDIKSGKSAIHDAELTQRFGQIHFPIEQKTFEERVFAVTKEFSKI